jgi:D-3-phosphoglycerate dehydrogenase / 2-oxoglutarate reductase
MRILNLEPDNYSADAHALLSEAGVVDNGPMSREELLRRVGDYDALIVRFGHRIDRPVLDAGRTLRAVACAATGADHIDVAHAQAKAIAVVSLAGETEFLRSIPASAEHSWALLLALTRRVPAAADAVRRGEWERDLYRGNDLAGKTLGIVGCGRIGEKTAAFGQAFRMRVIAYDPYRADLPSGVQRVQSLAVLMRGADVIMVHVPLNPETEQMIGRTALAELKPGAVLVNTARGAVLDEHALLDALATGHMAGAALDVLKDETPAAVTRNSLVAYAREHDNLILTPHIAGATIESMAATELFVARKLVQVLQQSAVLA